MAVDPNIKKKANDIRNKVYGKEVRESLASGLEAMSSDVIENEGRQSVVESRQDGVESQWQSVIDETTNLDVVSAPEIIAARNGEANLKARLDKTTAQLAQTTNDVTSLDTGNADEPLRIINYLGNTENFHPKVLYFENGWNGFNYWMGYTPYPRGNTEHENPCIAVSNDLKEWTTPIGLTNPLDEQPADGYNSDAHLVYREDLDQLELWWRAVIGSRRIIYRRYSVNGIDWSTRELVFDSKIAGMDLMSPAISFEEGKYKIWFVGQGTGNIYYTESSGSSLGSWADFNRVDLDFKSENLMPWHVDVTLTDKGHEFIISCYEVGLTPSNQDLYHSIEKQDGSFSEITPIIRRNKNVKAFDHRNLYRASLLKVKDEYLVFYSATASNNKRSIALSRGTSINALNGVNMNDGTQIVDSNILVDYDVMSVDVLEFQTNGECVVESFHMGQTGQRIVLTIGRANTKVTLVEGDSFALPNGKNYSWDGLRNPVELIFHNSKWRLLGTEKKESKIEVINSSTELTNFDVSDIDLIRFEGSGISEVHSFVGAYTGKRVTLINASSQHDVKIKHHSNRIALHRNMDYSLTNEQRVVELIYETGAWKVFTPELQRTLTLTGNNIENLDVSGVSTLLINGDSPTTIKSLVGGFNGKEINIVPVRSSATPVTIKEGNGFALPDSQDYQIQGLRNPIKLVYATGNWRKLS